MKIYFLLFCFIWSGSAISQNDKEFYYDQARTLLAQRKIDEALVPLKKLYRSQPKNANINFLMGAAYTELPGYQNESVYHLKKAIQSVTSNYEVSSYQEDKAPFYVYYYLSVALVELDKCAEAEKALEKFQSYEDLLDEYYKREGNKHLVKCDYELYGDDSRNWDKLAELPANYDPTHITPTQVTTDLKNDSLSIEDLKSKGLLTEKIKYTTNAPLYGVQIGSTSEIIPINRFGNLKNIDAFVDKNGLIRYVVGHFSYHKQAESLMEVLRKKGYNDAFVVNVNDERKYSNAVVSYNDINIKSGMISGKVTFAVQLGAFEDEIPDELAKAYLQVDGLEEIKYNQLTLITTSSFDKFQDAEKKESQLHNMGFTEAFVIAFNKGKKISLEKARAVSQ